MRWKHGYQPGEKQFSLFSVQIFKNLILPICSMSCLFSMCLFRLSRVSGFFQLECPWMSLVAYLSFTHTLNQYVSTVLLFYPASHICGIFPGTFQRWVACVLGSFVGICGYASYIFWVSDHLHTCFPIWKFYWTFSHSQIS
jgi:hypothetical protein